MSQKTLNDHVKNLTQNFAHTSSEQSSRLTAAIKTLIHDAHDHATTLRATGKSDHEIANAIANFVEGANRRKMGFKGEAYERLLINSGFDLKKFEPGYGTFKFLSRHTGSAHAERDIETQLARHLREAHGIEWGASRLDETRNHRRIINGVAIAGVGGALLTGGIAADRLNKRLDADRKHQLDQTNHLPTPHTRTQTLNAIDEKKEKNKNPVTRWLNDKPLDVMQWASNIMIAPPSLYRFTSAAYFSASLWGGMQIANALTGRKLPLVKSSTSVASLLKKEDVGILKPIYGMLKYTPGSVTVQDRARQAAHYIIPISLGGVGTYVSNKVFFHDRAEKLKDPQTLEDYVDRISMEQSKPFSILMAATSIFGAGSGLHLLPVFSYSGNLHNNFLLANGNQVALPGIGQWWSGNAGLTPWGVKRTLDYMTDYLSNNEAARPKEMPSLVHSVIGKLYPTLSEDALIAHKQELLDRIYEVRDSYLVNGVIPTEKQPALASAMKKMLGGVGLENLLMASGLNPAGADLAHNGASGSIGNFLGAKKSVGQLQEKYRQTFSERIAKSKERTSPNDYLRALADSRPDVLPAANDNAGKASFAERVKGETSANPTLSV